MSLLLFTRISSLLLLMLMAFPALSQTCNSNRYKAYLFNHQKHTDVIYGNAPSIPPVYVSENVTVDIDLKMDIFEPANDTLSKRPCVIMAFGGGFLIGSKEDEDMQAVCDSLARKGYVTASIQYRLNMNASSEMSAERAVYRATQDYSAAVRFLKEHADQYRIDTNYIFAGGASAGSFAAMHMAYAEESNRPQSTYAAGGLTPRPDLGCFNCSGNSYPHSPKVRGLINCWGAIADTSWIEEADDTPIISFHGDQDLIVPYDRGFPFTALATLPQVYGSYSISERMDNIGVYNEFVSFPGVGHNIWGTVINNNFTPGPSQHFSPILSDISNFLYLMMKPETSAINGAAEVCSLDTATYSINAQAGSEYCWVVDNGELITINGNTVEVQWHAPGTGELSVVEKNHLQVPGDTQNISVNILELPQVSAGSDAEMCAGDTISISGSGEGETQWLIDPDILYPLYDSTLAYPEADTYFVFRAEDSNGCVNYDTLFIEVHPAPPIPLITATGNTLYTQPGFEDYQWYLNGNPINAHSDSLNALQDGSYTVEVTDTNGCTNSSDIFEFVYTGIKKGAPSRLLELYPNPATERIFLDFQLSDITELTISDCRGRLQYHKQLSPKEENVVINTQSWPAGIYFISLLNSEFSVRRKFVVLNN